METTLRIVTLVLYASVYVLYFANIHKTVKLLGDGNKFGKTSFFVAGIHIGLKLFLELAPVSKTTGRILWALGVPLMCLSIFLSHRQLLLKSVYTVLLYLSIESCLGSSINLLIDIAVPMKHREFSGIVFYFLLNLAYFLVVARYLPKIKDDLILVLGFIDRKTYVFVLIFAKLLSLLTSLIRAAEIFNASYEKFLFFVKLLVIPMCIVSLFIMILLISNNMSKFYYKRSAELMDRQLDMQAEYYQKIGEMTTDIKKFRHDYKNHMHCLKSLLDSDKNNEAREYLDSISANPVMNTSSFKSGNTIADAILGDKAAIAARENFRLDFTGVISEKISAFDICTILSNALDNSIEACRRLKTAEEKLIEVNCVLKNDMQLISISNPSDTDDRELKTSKANKTEHGFGLYNIKKTVAALDGTVNISQTSPVFVLDVMFRVDISETA